MKEKESWQDEYLKWICGYANAYGGTIYIGTDDHGKVVGIHNAKDLLERIPNKITDTSGTVKNYVSSVYDKIGIKERNYLILKFGHIIADYDQSNERK